MYRCKFCNFTSKIKRDVQEHIVIQTHATDYWNLVCPFNRGGFTREGCRYTIVQKITTKPKQYLQLKILQPKSATHANHFDCVAEPMMCEMCMYTTRVLQMLHECLKHYYALLVNLRKTFLTLLSAFSYKFFFLFLFYVENCYIVW